MNLIRKARELRKMSQGQLARKSGIDRIYISRIETGAIKYPRIITALKISQALGIPIENLWQLEERKNGEDPS